MKSIFVLATLCLVASCFDIENPPIVEEKVSCSYKNMSSGCKYTDQDDWSFLLYAIINSYLLYYLFISIIFFIHFLLIFYSLLKENNNFHIFLSTEFNLIYKMPNRYSLFLSPSHFISFFSFSFPPYFFSTINSFFTKNCVGLYSRGLATFATTAAAVSLRH